MHRVGYRRRFDLVLQELIVCTFVSLTWSVVFRNITFYNRVVVSELTHF